MSDNETKPPLTVKECCARAGRARQAALTPEERKAMAVKAWQTRRARAAAKDAELARLQAENEALKAKMKGEQ